MAENPKALAAVRDQKPRLDLLERPMLEEVARAAAAGADKYGIANYREVETHARTYAAAILRHALAYLSGEDIDPDSGCHHLACVGSNVNVFFGALDAGTMTDDRGPQPRTEEQQAMSDANNQANGVKPDLIIEAEAVTREIERTREMPVVGRSDVIPGHGGGL